MKISTEKDILYQKRKFLISSAVCPLLFNLSGIAFCTDKIDSSDGYTRLAATNRPESKSAALSPRPAIPYPQGTVSNWYGFKRHDFVLDGRKGFIVEPRNPAPGLPWSWCMQWADSFVPRTPALKLLERGFHHVYFDIFDTAANPDGIKKLETFYAMLQKMGFHRKAALTGMSYGGLFAFRWAAEHPETVAVIYADAPVCDLGFMHNRDKYNAKTQWLDYYRKESRRVADAYRTDVEKLSLHPLSPNNNFLPIAKAGIPILCIRSGQDLTVPPESNIDIFAERLRKAGGRIEIIRRDLFGHHPHGLDDPQMLVDFILHNYPEF